MLDKLNDKSLDETVAKMFLGWSLSSNAGPGFMTKKAREATQWVVRKTEAPFSALNGESVWEGATPFEALGKAIAAFDVKVKPVVDDGMEYDEDAILDAGAVLNGVYNLNYHNEDYDDVYKATNILKDMMGKYTDPDSDLVKARFQQFVDVVSSSEYIHEVVEENTSFINFLRNQIVDEDYTLCHHIIKNEPTL